MTLADKLAADAPRLLQRGICPLCLFILELDWDGHFPRCLVDRVDWSTARFVPRT